MPIFAQAERSGLQCTKEEAWALIGNVGKWEEAGLAQKVVSEQTTRYTVTRKARTQTLEVISRDDSTFALEYKVVSGLAFPLTSLQGKIRVYDGVTVEWDAEATAVFGAETAFKCQLGNAIRATLDDALCGFEVALRKCKSGVGGGGEGSGVMTKAAACAATTS